MSCSLPGPTPVTVVLAPGAGLELLAPWAISRHVTAPSLDVTPMLLSAAEGLYALRPTTFKLGGVPVWLGDDCDVTGEGGVLVAEVMSQGARALLLLRSGGSINSAG